MRSTWFALATAAAAVLCLVAQSSGPAAQRDSINHTHPQPSSLQGWASAGGFPRQLYDAAMRVHGHMLRTPPSGNADVDFLVQMIPHHEGAVEMARLYLVSGDDPLIRRLAEDISAGQQAEIIAMQARLAILRKSADPNPGGFPSLGGARGQ